jgi:hypothetical protein
VWQQLVEETGLNLVSVAVDVQGPAVVRPWTEGVDATFTTLVDRDAQLNDRLSLAAVPYVLAVEDGRLIQPVTAIDVRKNDHADAVREWALGRAERIELAPKSDRPGSRTTEQAAAWLAVARFALDEDRLKDATDALERGFGLDPDNWVIRKQRWALQEPDRFYAGDIDVDWQADQEAAGR